MALTKAIDVANWFIAKSASSGDVVTHLKVQKLLYYAEAWCQALEGEELFDEHLQAWAHGPVVPEVFHEFKQHGWRPLPVPEKEELPDVPPSARRILNQVYDTYGDLPAKTLEDMTHNDRPWIKARGDLPPEARCEETMPKDEIGKFFKKKYLK